ncbi:MAG: hypothetical protein K8R68_01055 [Bacteroidales bacterium]|nr:hypothetical protein [Bacteroidales bacterium]
MSRRIGVQTAQAWNYGWGIEMNKAYGISHLKTLTIRDTLKTDYYVDKLENNRYNLGMVELLNNFHFLNNFNNESKKNIEYILSKFKYKLRSNVY